ncbi:hypothetical protein H9660_05200 [Clostridium sp. Sa3CUN1]|uniref:Uncharacterized protein n=1 Tax=Clostridium gallinarum TaxID=2762246 RepID=A0ABR8Q2A8_9CLOT|nr:hypothetical protein [Clostridium gallinarum]MBD7914535.1 hypothetical protein [Clostridium gallinarum]
MNRQERRKRERQVEKKMDVLRKLPEKEILKINKIIDEVSGYKTGQMMELVDKTLEAVLINIGFTLKEVRKVKLMLAEFLTDEENKLKMISKENVNMAKLQKEVTEFMKGLIEQGKSKPDVIEETLYKFPKASKNLVNREFGKLKDEQDIEDATNYIFGEETKKLKEEIEKESSEKIKEEAKKVSEEVARQLEKEEHIAEVSQKIEEVKEEKEVSKGLEIIEKEVIKIVKAKGIHGIYEAKTGIGVALENEGYKIAFKDVNELEVFCNEFKKIFEEI